MKWWTGILLAVVLLLCDGCVLAQEEINTEQETEISLQIEEIMDTYMKELQLEELQESIEQMVPEISFNLKDSIRKMMRGELPLNMETIKQVIKQAFAAEVQSQRSVFVQILVLAAAASVFANFVKIFENNQISDVAFYMIYLLLFVLLMKAFGNLSRLTEENLGQILQFMRLLLPVYLVVSSLAAGSVTAIGFYELTLLFLTAAQMLLTYVVLPGIRFYVLFLLLNYVSREAYLTKLAELIKTALAWILKTLLAFVIGIQTIQSLLLPVIDALKNSLWSKAVNLVPVLGNTLNAVTETVLGTAVLLKNAVGVMGMIAIVLICLIPVVRLAVSVFLYKTAAAVIQPVSDRRIPECVSAVGEGAVLLLKTVSVTAVMFLITLVLVTASIRSI
ncbi:MAG: stage III sporulation protein AE [Marvinbryantia sp.]|jgi:stage III sporulation protein AE